jgi:hypothetical protein
MSICESSKNGHRSFEKEIRTLVQHTPDARGAQQSPISNRSRRFIPLAILCLGLIALSVALILGVAISMAWPHVMAHLAPVFAVVPTPWGCTGSPVPC